MDSLDSAVCWARYNADFPSSGFGNGTVGKVGSGSKCRKIIKGNHVGTFHFKFNENSIVYLEQCSKILKHTYVFAPSHEQQVEIHTHQTPDPMYQPLRHAWEYRQFSFYIFDSFSPQKGLTSWIHNIVLKFLPKDQPDSGCRT